jgi:hypothetical protein
MTAERLDALTLADERRASGPISLAPADWAALLVADLRATYQLGQGQLEHVLRLATRRFEQQDECHRLMTANALQAVLTEEVAACE